MAYLLCFNRDFHDNNQTLAAEKNHVLKKQKRSVVFAEVLIHIFTDIS